MQKVYQWLGLVIEEKSDGHVQLRLPAKRLRMVLGGLGILLLLGLGLTIWGLVTRVETWHLRQQVELQQEQLKLLDAKTKIMEQKLQQMEILDKELRQMVTGAEQGSAPEGGGTSEEIAKAKQGATLGKSESLSYDSLIQRIYGLEAHSQRTFLSLLTMKNVLESGGRDRILEIQQRYHRFGQDPSQTTPSIWPAKGTITSTFGMRINPVTHARAVHEGIDIANDYGTPIGATAAGKVISAGYVDGYGLLVTVDHGNGFETRYGHMSSILVTPGKTIKRGDILGLMGSTGRSTGPHVHYEVIVNGTPMDPILFMKTM